MKTTVSFSIDTEDNGDFNSDLMLLEHYADNTDLSLVLIYKSFDKEIIYVRGNISQNRNFSRVDARDSHIVQRRAVWSRERNWIQPTTVENVGCHRTLCPDATTISSTNCSIK